MDGADVKLEYGKIPMHILFTVININKIYFFKFIG
jgi:hypothetical protein